MMQLLTTSYVKDYKGYSLVQTSFTELPNTCPYMYPFITLPVHFDYLIPTNRSYLPVLSPVVLSIHRFTLSSTNWFHLCFSPGFTCTLFCQFICWSVYWQTHLKMNVPVNFDASGYNLKDLPADSTVYMSIDAPIQKLSPSFLCIHSELPPRSTHPPNYCSTYIHIYLETNLPLYHDAFLPANHEDLPVD